jgi:hypothetical protein
LKALFDTNSLETADNQQAQDKAVKNSLARYANENKTMTDDIDSMYSMLDDDAVLEELAEPVKPTRSVASAGKKKEAEQTTLTQMVLGIQAKKRPRESKQPAGPQKKKKKTTKDVKPVQENTLTQMAKKPAPPKPRTAPAPKSKTIEIKVVPKQDKQKVVNESGKSELIY